MILNNDIQMNNKLFLVSTPIGNYDDITLRALQILKSVDFIICEEYKQARRLLSHYEIEKELVSLNEHNEKELGYRFRACFWGKGYGTETTKGMLNYYFQEMNVNKVTADVNIANIGSVKILDKFMKPVREFFNERDNCTDRRYELEKNNWLQHRI